MEENYKRLDIYNKDIIEKFDGMYVDFLWGDWFPGHHGCTETKELPEACSPFQGSPDDKYSIDCSWNSTLKIYRTHFLDGGFFS